MSRACRRPGCDRSAVARLSYDAVTCQVWLDVLPDRPGPVQEICELHVDRLTVPRGWMVCDRRVEEPAMFVTDPTPTPTTPRSRRRPPDPVRLVPMVEPELFDQDPERAPSAPTPPEESDRTSPPDVAARVTGAAPTGDPLLQPSSPLLARAFRAAGTSPTVLSSRPDDTRDHDRDDGADR